jgi:hypothetical protein
MQECDSPRNSQAETHRADENGGVALRLALPASDDRFLMH